MSDHRASSMSNALIFPCNPLPFPPTSPSAPRPCASHPLSGLTTRPPHPLSMNWLCLISLRSCPLARLRSYLLFEPARTSTDTHIHKYKPTPTHFFPTAHLPLSQTCTRELISSANLLSFFFLPREDAGDNLGSHLVPSPTITISIATTHTKIDTNADGNEEGRHRVCLCVCVGRLATMLPRVWYWGDGLNSIFIHTVCVCLCLRVWSFVARSAC